MARRTWLITGCSSGFGRVMAEMLLGRGERVAITARKPETLDDLVATYGDQALALKLDVTRPEQVEAAVAAARDRFGAIDVLVNNAGYGHMGTIEDAPMEDARAMMETNLFGVLAMIRAVIPEMVERRGGQIVNIGSVAGQVGFPALSYYCASKFALAGLSESLGAEVAPLGIAVTLVQLGPFETNFANAMSIVAPSAHYDLAALSKTAGNANWEVGDPREAAAALIEALAAPSPPRRLIVGQPALDVIGIHDARREDERDRWLATSRLEPSALR